MTATEMLQRVQAGHFDAEELLELHKNCLSKNVPELLDAIHTQLWQRFPAKARKRFGAKGQKAQLTLEALAKDLAARYNLRDNQVGSHVKVGGLARAKDGYFLDLYISYKRKGGESVALSLLQKDPGSAEFAQVTRYKAGKNASRDSVDYAAEAWPEAVSHYEAQLAELLTPG